MFMIVYKQFPGVTGHFQIEATKLAFARVVKNKIPE